jgi:hypothetical protein
MRKKGLVDIIEPILIICVIGSSGVSIVADHIHIRVGGVIALFLFSYCFGLFVGTIKPNSNKESKSNGK